METAKRVKTDTLKKDLIDNLPEGCSLKTVNSEANETQEHTQTVSQDNDTVCIGSFVIDISKISVESLKKIRPLVPQEDYKIIKKRKSAREQRKSAKEKKQDYAKEFA